MRKGLKVTQHANIPTHPTVQYRIYSSNPLVIGLSVYPSVHDGLILASQQNLLLLANEIQHTRRHQAIPCQGRAIPSQEDLSLNSEIRGLTEIMDYFRRHLSRATVSPSNIPTTNPRQEVSEKQGFTKYIAKDQCVSERP